jgi:hypothetical protein
MLILSTSLLVISAFNYGFSDQAFASCQAMDAFERQFGYYNEKADVWKLRPLFTSLYNSLKAGGQIIGVCLFGFSRLLTNLALGVFLGGYISNKYGRRMCISVMSIYALGSASVVISSRTDAQIQAGRALHCEKLHTTLFEWPRLMFSTKMSTWVCKWR